MYLTLLRFLAMLVAAGTIAAGPAHAAPVCQGGPAAAAAANAAGFETLDWTPFGRPERGWALYATRIAVEIGTPCPAVSPGFAAALAQWQGRAGLAATGVFDPASFVAMKQNWSRARAFVRQTRDGSCPEPPPPAQLATARPAESYAGKTIQLRADALAAYRRMVAAAHRSLDARDPQWFTIFSGYRDPVSDDVRCIIENNCQGIVRAACSAHRTGLAIDLHVGAAPGFGPDSSNDTNRRAMVRTPAYRWLVANAARFGFTNYVFEPWHWEWSPPQAALSRPENRPMVRAGQQG